MNLRQQIKHLQNEYGKQVLNKLKPLQEKVKEIQDDNKDVEIFIRLYHHRNNNNNYNDKCGFYGSFECEVEECYYMNLIEDAKQLPLTLIARILESNFAEIVTNDPIWDTINMSI